MAFQTGGKNRSNKRELNAELNLTSFIDLLSTCVCFLLIAAVWTQIESMEVKQSHGTESSAESPKQLELDFKFITAESVRLTLKGQGVKKEITIDSQVGENFKSHLSQEFTKWLVSISNNQKLQVAAAMIHPASGVNYGRLIEALDVLRQSHIKNIGIVPTKGDK
jgi:biopolymer transport protein TolR